MSRPRVISMVISRPSDAGVRRDQQVIISRRRNNTSVECPGYDVCEYWATPVNLNFAEYTHAFQMIDDDAEVHRVNNSSTDFHTFPCGACLFIQDTLNVTHYNEFHVGRCPPCVWS
ncbi:unnamed protein product [Ectocarpus sp. 13 AM-2016]